MKKASMFAVILTAAIALNGCGSPAAEQFSAPPVQPQRAEELGEVTMLASDAFAQEKDSQEILDLICQGIQKQKNIAMHITMVSCRPGDQLEDMAAAGNLPEIVVRSPEQWEQGAYGFRRPALPAPMRLNETIEKYGPNLKAIPERCWEWSRIGDAVVSIPSSYQVPSDFLAVNRKVLDEYGWTVPKTFEEFEQLLRAAEDKGVRPMVRPLPIAWFGVPHDSDGDCPYLYTDESNRLMTYYESPAFLNYLETMRKWKADGYFEETSLIKDPPPEKDDNWLTRPYAGAEGEVVLPPMAPAGSAPFIAEVYHTNFQLEAYQRPEALVAFYDWILASEENYLLVECGKEGADYTVDSAGKIILAQAPATQGSLDVFFQSVGMDEKLAGRLERKTDASAAEALAYASSHVTATDAPHLPVSCWRYAKLGSALIKACDDQNTFDGTMRAMAASCIAGTMTVDDFKDTVGQNADLMADYIRLVKDQSAGVYDPSREMFQPVG